MNTTTEHQTPANPAAFQLVAECLYRHTSSGTYYALVKRSGKQYRRSLKTKDRKLAERRLADFRRKVDLLDHSADRTSVAFSDWAKQWLASTTPHMKTTSARRRVVSVGQLNRFFGPALIRSISTATCEAWAARRGPTISASTYNNERDTLIAILDYAKREGLLLDNPAAILPRRKLPKTQVLIPSKEQFAKLINTLRPLDVRYQAGADLLELLAYSGMRLAEATATRWREIDFEKGQFVVTGGETGTKNHEVRVVPLFPAMRALLERLRGGRTIQPDEFVVPIDRASKALARGCQVAALPHFTHHCMRHYFVSNAIEAGIDFKTIAAWVGHKDGGQLVAERYGHLRDTHSFEMAKRMTFSASISPVIPAST